MTDHKDRFNKVVNEALKTSRYSRAYHEAYYGKDKAFTYAMTDSDAAPAADRLVHIEGKAPERLVINMRLPDVELVRGMHHELVHVHQNVVLKKAGFGKISEQYQKNDHVFLAILKEIQAKTMEQEGPLLSFLDEAKHGNRSNAGWLHAYAAQDQKTFGTYTAALTGNSAIHQMSVSQVIDHLGYACVNDLVQKPQAEQKEAILNARQAVAYSFMADATALQKTVTNALVEFDNMPRSSGQRYRIKFSQDEFEVNSVLLKPVSEALTTIDDEPFLPYDKWHAVLGSQQPIEVMELVKEKTLHRVQEKVPKDLYSTVRDRHKHPERDASFYAFQHYLASIDEIVRKRKALEFEREYERKFGKYRGFEMER